MSEIDEGHRHCPTVQKPKEQTLSEIIRKSREDGSYGTDRVNLRRILVQRTMARHGFSEDQALALILPFSSP
jgi:hypothetical protein